MLIFVAIQLVAFAACKSGFAEVCLESGLRTSPSQFSSTIRGDAGLADYPSPDRYRCVPGAVHLIAFLQSLFNPHTSTALAA